MYESRSLLNVNDKPNISATGSIKFHDSDARSRRNSRLRALKIACMRLSFTVMPVKNDRLDQEIDLQDSVVESLSD